MKILCTMPGKYGDCFWSLPTARAISEAAGEPVDFLVSPKYASHVDLLRRQPYLGKVDVWPSWQTQDVGPAPMSPWSPFNDELHHQPLDLNGVHYDHVVHLGYRAWPDRPLPQCIYEQTKREYPELPIAPLDLDRPWIRTTYPLPACDLALGFTDEHFELKYGLYWLLYKRFGEPKDSSPYKIANLSTSPRWCAAGASGFDWQAAAAWLASAKLFVGCNSALHVLACATGAPVVMLEPSEARWNDIFYAYGKTGSQVTLVTGNDGRPTFDARHLIDTIVGKLAVQTEASNGVRAL